jgi:hypothetical protein
MDKYQNLIATIVAGIILAWLASIEKGLNDSKHNDDIQNVHLEYMRKSDAKQWDMYDEMIVRQIESLLEENKRLKKEKEELLFKEKE